MNFKDSNTPVFMAWSEDKDGKPLRPRTPGSHSGPPADRATRRRLADTARRSGPDESADAAFALAARTFDPRSATQDEIAALAERLLRAGAISERDHLILQTDPTAGRMAVARDRTAARDAIRDWQGRRAMDMELGRIGAVEASTRALAILARLAALREAR